MCGIAGIHRTGTKPVPKINELADALLLAIESRGTHATGLLAMMNDGKVQLEKMVIPASAFVKAHGKIRPSAKTVLLHTRFATVGRREDPRNAHPTGAGTVASIHNGTIYNADSLFKQYKLKRLGTVDSEIVPALIDHLGWANAVDALKQLDGGAALAIVSTQHTDEVILARVTGYPMVYMVTEGMVVWASTEAAIKQAWHKVYGTRRKMGEIKTLPEYTMAVVNGKVTTTTIPHVRRSYGRPVPFRRSSGVRVTTTAPPVSKRARKAARKAGRSTPKPLAFEAGYIHGPHGMEYVGVTQAASFEELLDFGMSVAEAYEIVTEELEEWAAEEAYYDGMQRTTRGTVYTDSQAWLAARERGEV